MKLLEKVDELLRCAICLEFYRLKTEYHIQNMDPKKFQIILDILLCSLANINSVSLA